MANSYEDFLGSFTLESPDFKRALKILIKYEIHVLLQRLSDTGEESVVITASIADRTNGHLGSQKGRSFLREAKIKALEEQFLHYCTEPPYEQRSQLSVETEGSSPVYIKQEPREMLMGYEEQEQKRRQRLRNDRGNSLEGTDNRPLVYGSNCRSPIHIVDEMMDQSEDCVVDLREPVENSVSQFLSKFDDSPEMIRDCYSERGLIGKCNDICCRGTYLDLVGPSIRPAIPTLDGNGNGNGSNWSTNSPEEPRAVNTELPYFGEQREENYYKGVDLSVDKTECNGNIRDDRVRQNLAETFSDRQKMHELSDQTDNKRTLIENTFRTSPNQSQEMVKSFTPRTSDPKSPNESVTASLHGNDLSKQQSVANHQGFTMGSKPELKNRRLRTSVTSEVEFEDKGKRKLCSRVPECKLRHLLQGGYSNDAEKLITNKGNVSVKAEPCFNENEAKMENSLNPQEKTGLTVQELVDKEIHTEDKSFDQLKRNVKQETVSLATDEMQNNETTSIGSDLGRSLRFICRYCNQTFKNKQFRELHEKQHLARHPYICESCGAGFNEETTLEEHSKIHITNPVFKCENCGYRTTRKFRMNSHREICGKPSRVFVCPYCQKPFLAKRYMKVHMKSHDLSNVHHCPYCVNTYPLKNSLLKHMKTKHKRF